MKPWQHRDVDGLCGVNTIIKAVHHQSTGWDTAYGGAGQTQRCTSCAVAVTMAGKIAHKLELPLATQLDMNSDGAGDRCTDMAFASEVRTGLRIRCLFWQVERQPVCVVDLKAVLDLGALLRCRPLRGIG